MTTSSKSVKILILLLVSFIIVFGLYLVFGKNKSESRETSVDISQLPDYEKTSDWKTQTNETYGLSFKYPNNYKLEETSLEVGIVAWMSVISNSEKEEDKDAKIWDVLGIHVGVRRKMGLGFSEWVDNECKGNKRISEKPILVDGKPAYEFVCSLGNSEEGSEVLFRTVAIDKGDFVYTLVNNGYKRDKELDEVFDGVINTYRFD